MLAAAMTQFSRPETHRCFVCGPANPIGMHLQFEEEGEGVVADFVPGDLYVGYEGLVHGGLLAAVLDDAMANVWAWRGQPAVTVSLSVRFRRPVQPGERLRVSGEPVGARRAAMQRARATITRADGTVVAEGDGVVMVGSLPPMVQGA